MGRLVKIQSGKEFALKGTTPETQTYMEQVIKYIPAEIIGGYVAINGFLASLEGKIHNTSLWINFAFCSVLTVVYLLRLSKPGDATKTQIIVSLISFMIWAYSITGETGIFGPTGINIYYSQLASVSLVAFSLLAPLFPKS